MKTNFAKKIFKILTIATFSVFVFLILFSFNTQDTFSAQSADRKEVSEATTSYIDDEGYEQNLTDITTTYYYLSNGKKHYSTIDRTRTYADNEGVTHTLTSYFTDYNYKEGEGKWSDEEEIKSKEGEKTEIKTTDGKKYTYTLLQSLPGANETLSKDVTIEQYLTWVFRFTLALAGFLAVMMIVIGGVEYIISGANESMRTEAKKRINSAISGLVLALVSYLVLYTINPSLVDFNNNCFFKDCEEEITSSNNKSDTNSNNDNNKETISTETAPVIKPGEANNPTIYDSPTGGTSGKMEQIQN